jgi:uncharacterized protein (DUF1778 family)
VDANRDVGSIPVKSLITTARVGIYLCNDTIVTGLVTMVSLRYIAFLHWSCPMPTSHTSKNVDASVPLNIRIKPATRNLIDRAAELLGKTRTDFMLEASERRAEEVLLDRTVFTVSPEVYAEYLARLDAPAQSNERLKRTMLIKAPWDEA